MSQRDLYLIRFALFSAADLVLYGRNENRAKEPLVAVPDKPKRG